MLLTKARLALGTMKDRDRLPMSVLSTALACSTLYKTESFLCKQTFEPWHARLRKFKTPTLQSDPHTNCRLQRSVGLKIIVPLRTVSATWYPRGIATDSKLDKAGQPANVHVAKNFFTTVN